MECNGVVKAWCHAQDFSTYEDLAKHITEEVDTCHQNLRLMMGAFDTMERVVKVQRVGEYKWVRIQWVSETRKDSWVPEWHVPYPIHQAYLNTMRTRLNAAVRCNSSSNSSSRSSDLAVVDSAGAPFPLVHSPVPTSHRCPKCSRVFAKTHALDQHLVACTSKLGEKHVCGKCSDEFGTADALAQHSLAKHTGEVHLVRCKHQDCKGKHRKFSDSALEQHMASHNIQPQQEQSDDESDGSSDCMQRAFKRQALL